MSALIERLRLFFEPRYMKEMRRRVDAFNAEPGNPIRLGWK